MYRFVDKNGCQVKLVFDEAGFGKEAKHIWVVCRYKDKWLLTSHRTRGLEFPGGKVEHGEALSDAANREVWEETGAKIKSLHYIGMYEVTCRQNVMYKAIYFAEISVLIQRNSYHETNGPVLLEDFPDSLKTDPSFSFIMKDKVLNYTLEQLARKQLVKL
ncbi:RNA deprotection pyrophosphohydrolase [Halalkalibacter kiskunsagensis]|uniref:RNA deprotection pyrophosphohydrolase n=1 Tax=Halalkalibacter kiskunsagensis TaxID=1548599 RepID=A0ABV6KIL4_9BACI